MGVSKWAWPCDVGMDAYRGHTHFACPYPDDVDTHTLWPHLRLATQFVKAQLIPHSHTIPGSPHGTKHGHHHTLIGPPNTRMASHIWAPTTTLGPP